MSNCNSFYSCWTTLGAWVPTFIPNFHNWKRQYINNETRIKQFSTSRWFWWHPTIYCCAHNWWGMKTGLFPSVLNSFELLKCMNIVPACVALKQLGKARWGPSEISSGNWIQRAPDHHRLSLQPSQEFIVTMHLKLIRLCFFQPNLFSQTLDCPEAHVRPLLPIFFFSSFQGIWHPQKASLPPLPHHFHSSRYPPTGVAL